MKLANRAYGVTLLLLTMVFVASAQTPTATPRASGTTTATYDKDARSANDPRNTAPTVGTGGPVGGPTGLFTVYDGQTLRRGEFTFSAAWSNFDRDPGNADFTEIPVSFQIGVTNNLELFFNTDAYRGVKINSPRNLSSFYLPNSRVQINGVFTSAPAIVLAPGSSGIYFNQAVFRPTGTAPFVQYPYIGGNAGTFGLQPPFFSGPTFGFPAGTNAVYGVRPGGEGASNFPGIGSVYGSILPGVVLQTTTLLNRQGNPAGEGPLVFALAPSYLPDAPFINRTWGESSFSTFTGGLKWRFTSVNNPVGVGVIAYYKWYADSADDFGGFNQLQRGASPGGNGNWARGDIGVVGFADARLRKWLNLSANIGYNYTSSVKSDAFGTDVTLLDRPDEVMAAIGVDFPVNKYFQPIAEFRTLQYVGGRTPNAFENHPIDGLVGARIYPARWFSIGAAYRHHFNQQDRDSFDKDDRFTTSVLVNCVPPGQGCAPATISQSFQGMPPGFAPSSDPHGFIFQLTAGRRNKRQAEIVNQPANVDSVTLSDTTIDLGCPDGFRSASGSCNDSTSITVTTSASDPENDSLIYSYSVSGGRIVGEGRSVSWDLSGVRPGTYTITAGVDDGCGVCGKTQTQTVTVRECPDCVRVCSCPSLSVTEPSGITQPGETMTFTANVSGGTQDNLTYNWTVSNGTIESGQGTSAITVRTTREMAGSNVTATVTLGGTDPNCNCTGLSASGTGPVADLPKAELVNEFGKMSNDEIRGQLDIFFQQLQSNPNAQGYVINYGSDREIAAREKLIRNHIAFRKFDAARITLVRGGDTGEGVKTKLYLVPPGAENPNP
ncbi:MAG: hypothetical protein ACK4S4_05330 [Pyrinomonadaceae bacterium]